MVRTRNWKYVTDLSSGSDFSPSGSTAHSQDELYDLINDPWELTNVAQSSENMCVISKMRALLLDWMLETEEYNAVPMPTVIGRGSKPEIDINQ
jgi:arylsulfatase A-like enzyme